MKMEQSASHAAANSGRYARKRRSDVASSSLVDEASGLQGCRTSPCPLGVQRAAVKLTPLFHRVVLETPLMYETEVEEELEALWRRTGITYKFQMSTKDAVKMEFGDTPILERRRNLSVTASAAGASREVFYGNREVKSRLNLFRITLLNKDKCNY